MSVLFQSQKSQSWVNPTNDPQFPSLKHFTTFIVPENEASKVVLKYYPPKAKRSKVGNKNFGVISQLKSVPMRDF